MIARLLPRSVTQWTVDLTLVFGLYVYLVS